MAQCLISLAQGQFYLFIIILSNRGLNALEKKTVCELSEPIGQEHPCAATVIRVLYQFITKPEDPPVMTGDRQ
jgi:hypothetical protein